MPDPVTMWSTFSCSSMGLLALTATALVGAPQIGYNWTFEERSAKADFIVIAQPIETRDTGHRTVHPSLRPDLPVIELETELEVLVTLKGPSQRSVRLKHYQIDIDEVKRRSGGNGGRINSGSELPFGVGKARITGGAPPDAYLLFLTVAEGGRFEPLSGHTFPTHTVFRLREADR